MLTNDASNTIDLAEYDAMYTINEYNHVLEESDIGTAFLELETCIHLYAKSRDFEMLRQTFKKLGTLKAQIYLAATSE